MEYLQRKEGSFNRSTHKTEVAAKVIQKVVLDKDASACAISMEYVV